MYYVVKQMSYNSLFTPPVCSIDVQRRWGPKKDKNMGLQSLKFEGPLGYALYKVLKPGTVIDISGGGIMRYPKPRQKRGGNRYGH